MTPDETTILVDTITIPYINEIKAQAAEIERLTAELAQARAERDELRANKGNDTVMLLDITSKYIKALEERDAAQAAHVAMHKAYGHVTGLVPFDPQSELKQLRASNHYMIEELTRLRAKQSGQQAGE